MKWNFKNKESVPVFIVRWTLAGIISGGTVEPCGAPGGYWLAVDVYRWINWVTFKAFDGEYC